MGLPYEIRPVGGLTVSSGTVTVAVDLPPRTRIHKVVVERTDTPGSGSFTVDLYNKEDAAKGNPITDSNGNTLTPKLFRVMPQFSGASGIAEYFADTQTGGFGHPFFSQDPPPKSRIQSNWHQLWIVITASAGTYCINIGTDGDMI